MSDLEWDSEEEFAAAAENYNCEPIYTDEHTLLIDHDVGEPEEFEQLLALACVAMNMAVVERQEWKSKGGNDHVRLRVNRSLTIEQRIALQACLGSDPKREVLSMARAQNGVARPSRLFRPRMSTII